MANENYSALASDAKTKRNRILYETDWTQMPDVTLANNSRLGRLPPRVA